LTDAAERILCIRRMKVLKSYSGTAILRLPLSGAGQEEASEQSVPPSSANRTASGRFQPACGRTTRAAFSASTS
jgi:hypothetical protein